MTKASINHFAAYHSHYKEKPEMTESTYNSFLFQPLPTLLSLSDNSFYWIIRFATYHLHYKEKIVSNLTWTFICTTACLYFSYGWSNLFLYDWNNLSSVFFFAHNDNSYTSGPGLVTKKGELPKTFIYFSALLQCLSLKLSLIFSKICQPIFEYILIFECATISN